MNNQSDQFNQPNIPSESQQPQPSLQPEIPKKPGLPTWASVLIMVGAVIIVGTGGYLAYQYFVPPAEPDELPATGEEGAADETADWQTYRNEEHGFEFEHLVSYYVISFIPEYYKNKPVIFEVVPICIDENQIDGAGTPIHLSVTIGSINLYPDLDLNDYTDSFLNLPSKKYNELDFWGDEKMVIEVIKNDLKYRIEIPNIIGKLDDTYEHEGICDKEGYRDEDVNYSSKDIERILNSFKFIEPDETADWQVYQNEEYGFEVKYPNNFTVGEYESSGRDDISFYNKDDGRVFSV